MFSTNGLVSARHLMWAFLVFLATRSASSQRFSPLVSKSKYRSISSHRPCRVGNAT